MFEQLQGLAGTLTGWRSRLKDGSYTSPSGLSQEFLYTAVSRVTSKRTASFEFIDIDDAYIQDNGHGARRYALVCLFVGDNHDLLASSFEASLLERGPGELQHPLYGTFRAIPTGDVTRRDDLVENANESVVEVTFSTTLVDTYPSIGGFPVSEILASIDGFNLAAAGDFDTAVDLLTKARQANIKGPIRQALRAVREAFEEASGSVSAARRELAESQSLIDEAIDTLVGSPVLLAQQLINYVQAPARLMAGNIDRLQGYARMLLRIFALPSLVAGNPADQSLQRLTTQARNEFALHDLMVKAGVIGAILSITDQVFTTRPQVFDAVDALGRSLDSAVVWRDDQAEALAVIDTGSSYQGMLDAYAQGVGFLTDSAFSVAPERGVVLDRARTIIDVCAELYGTTGTERLDFLISSNDFSGDEILEIPRGRRVVYYAA